MKITKIEPLLMSYVFPEPLRLPFWGGERTILKRDAMIIRVATDNGLVGYAPGPAHERAAREIREVIGPFLEGNDPRQWRRFDFQGKPETVKTYRAVEIAVMDAAARFEGCPLSDLIGPRKRDRIKLYGSAGMYMSPERYAEEAGAITAAGFPAYKMRTASGPDQDLETIALIRDAVGADVGLMIDAHAWWRMGDRDYSFETVAQLARQMARMEPLWLEEPLPPEDHQAYRDLRRQQTLPLASGEHEQTEESFLDLIRTEAVDVVQMDVCCQGGITMGQRIFQAASERGLKFAFHSWGTDLEVLAAAHLGISEEESVVEWLEYPCYRNGNRPGMYPFPLAEELLTEPLEIKEGYLNVPKAPGLGIGINEKVADKYPFQPGPWSYFRIDSPPQTIAVTGDHSMKWEKGPATGE